MSEQRRRLDALEPPLLGIEHPRCRICYRFADYSMRLWGRHSGRHTSRHYCADHLPPAYQPFKEEADRQLTELRERAEKLRRELAQGE